MRILIVGGGGAGKSTLARAVARRTGVLAIHLDAHYWHAGWEPTPVDDWRTVVAELVTQPDWVMDGNYSDTLDLRLPRADSVVLLDLPRRITLSRVIRRRIRFHGRTRPDMAPGCPERADAKFLRWVWTYRRGGRVRLLAQLDAAGAGDRLIRLTSRKAISAWLAGLPTVTAEPPSDAR